MRRDDLIRILSDDAQADAGIPISAGLWSAGFVFHVEHSWV